MKNKDGNSPLMYLVGNKIDKPDRVISDEEGKSLAQVFEGCNFPQNIKQALSNWQVLHTPGHTEGSCCFYNEVEQTFVSGDTLFFRSWGRTDLIGGNERKIHQSLAKIMEKCEEETKVYPGHDNTAFTIAENF